MISDPGMKRYPVLWADVVFWYDNAEFLPSDVEEAWMKAAPEVSAQLVEACRRVKSEYEAQSDALAARAALIDATAALAGMGPLGTSFGADTYRPGGQGHGGSARIIGADGGTYETEVVIRRARVRVRPMIHVRIGAPGAGTTTGSVVVVTGAAMTGAGGMLGSVQ